MTTQIQALVFDFDGLILDTETPEVQVWTRIYAEHGFEYPQELWRRNIGIWPRDSGFDPARHLHELAHDSLDEEALRARHRRESDLLIDSQPAEEGVSEYVLTARQIGMRLGIASSSWRTWVEGHLARLGLLSCFDRIVTSNEVAPGRTKPHPDLYVKALDGLGVSAAQAIAFEDSPHGVMAARAAGIYVVAVPNPVTAQLDLSQANLRLSSLAAMPLEELLERATQNTGN